MGEYEVFPHIFVFRNLKQIKEQQRKPMPLFLKDLTTSSFIVSTLIVSDF